MKMLADKIQNGVVAAFTKETRLDHRWVLALLLIIYMIGVALGNYLMFYNEVWDALGVPVLVHNSFADLRAVLSGFECTRSGHNVLISNPCDYKGYPLNYPRLWMWLTPLGLTTRQTDALGWSLAAILFICILIHVGKLNTAELFLYAVILLFPSVMLGVERGNVDLILFVLLCLVLWMMRSSHPLARGAAYTLALLTAMLKLFPVFAFVAIAREKKKNFFIALAGLGISFALYLITIANDLPYIFNQVPRGMEMSYGRMIIPMTLQPSTIFQRIFGFVLSDSQVVILSFILMAMTLVTAYLFAIRYRHHDFDSPSLYLDGFRIGAAIYIGTFALGNNWDYRLVFLVFTIPQMINWIKHDARWRGLSTLGLAALFLTFILSRFSLRPENPFHVPSKYFLPDEFLNWFLVFYYSVALLATLPEWAKQIAFPRNVKQTP